MACPPVLHAEANANAYLTVTMQCTAAAPGAWDQTAALVTLCH
jgi:hypothetical protein